MDAARLHRRRHRRGRRLPARRRRLHVRTGPSLAGLGRRGEQGQLTTWITITPDNIITILIPHCEMGQGTQTALAMMAAEELEADWTLVRVQGSAGARRLCERLHRPRGRRAARAGGARARRSTTAPTRSREWFGFQVTGGSTAVRGTGEYGMRVAGAAAKEMLVAAAAAQWGVSASECAAKRSRVTHAASGRSATFGELARSAACTARADQPDAQTPRQLHDPPHLAARVSTSRRKSMAARSTASTSPRRACSTRRSRSRRSMAASWSSVDTRPAEVMPGVKSVVKLKEAVAVVADSFWRARRALAALKPEFSDGGHGDVSTESIFAAFDKALGAHPAVPANAAKIVTAEYRAPFLAHATMEPMVCTAQVEGDRAEVWTGVQDPLNARSVAAKALGIETANVQLTNFMLGGGFGRRLPFTFDYVDLGVRVAKAMSPAPVKTIWTRENDIQHDYYRGAALSRHAGALDANGRRSPPTRTTPAAATARRSSCPMRSARRRRTKRRPTHPIRLGQWRSVLNSQHGFFKESFIDEMAHAAGKDPFEFRRGLLAHQPRFKAALEKAAAMSGWAAPLPPAKDAALPSAKALAPSPPKSCMWRSRPKGGSRC